MSFILPKTVRFLKRKLYRNVTTGEHFIFTVYDLRYEYHVWLNSLIAFIYLKICINQSI